jgi:hypothetical protein
MMMRKLLVNQRRMMAIYRPKIGMAKRQSIQKMVKLVGLIAREIYGCQLVQGLKHMAGRIGMYNILMVRDMIMFILAGK